MTATETFIKDAIAGDYKEMREWTLVHGVVKYLYIDDEGREVEGERFMSTILLDPNAWKAVSIARKWHEAIDEKHTRIREKMPYYMMHRFIDHLCDGKTIDEALSEL